MYATLYITARIENTNRNKPLSLKTTEWSRAQDLLFYLLAIMS